MLLSNENTMKELKTTFENSIEFIIMPTRLLTIKLIEDSWNELDKLYRIINLNAYHNTKHIEDCLIKLHALENKLENDIDIELFELAILFHDCVYDPSRIDNEEKSIKFMTKIMKNFGFENTKIEYMANLIFGNMRDSQYEYNIFRDIDYSILGEHNHTYKEYSKAIETEFTMVYAYEKYVEGRIEFLQKVRSYPRIFITDILGDIFKCRARYNIYEELEFLNREQYRIKNDK